MPGTEKQVTIKPKLNTAEFKAKAKEIDDAIASLKKHIAELSDSSVLGDRIKKATAAFNKSLSDANKSIDKTKQKIKELQAQMSESESKAGDIEQRVRDQVFSDKANKNYFKSVAEGRKNAAIFNGASPEEAQKIYEQTYNRGMDAQVATVLNGNKEYQEQISEIHKASDALKEQNAILDEQTKKRSEITGQIDEAADKIKKQNQTELDSLNADLEKRKTEKSRLMLNGRLGRDISDEQAQKARSQVLTMAGMFQKPSGSAGGSGGAADGLKRMLAGIKNIALAVFGVRTAWALVQKSMSYVTSENKEMANTIKGMSVAMGAMFQPAIEAAIRGVTRLFNYIAAIWKALTGINIIAKANAKLAKDAANARGPAKFDEVDVLQDPSGGAGTDNLMQEIELNEKLKEMTTELKGIWDGIKSSIMSAWEEAGNGERIMTALNALGESLWNWFINILDITRQWAENLDFSPLFSAVATFLEEIKPLLDDILEVLTWIYQNIVLPLMSYLIEEAIPVVLTILGNLATLIDTIYQTVLKPVWDFLWNTILQPFINTIGQQVIDILKDFSEKVQDASKWVREHKELLQTVLIVVGSLIVAFGLVMGALNTIHTVAMLVNGVISVATGLITFITSPIGLVVVAIAAVVAIIILVIKNWDKLVDAVKKGGEIIKSVFRAIGNFVKNILNGLISGFETMLNAVIRGINAIMWPIRQAPRLFGYAALDPISTVHLPRLARGAVIPPNNEFMAVLGDQTSGNNIEAPEDLIRSIVAEELSANNAEIVALLRVIAAKKLSISKREVGSAAVDYINDETDRRGGTSPISALSM
ncbi:hypothetical protein [Stecheria intestinalis]|uniref:hypothetical protein n=1 Tax=Stecheria intestinalis TaxID=2606630 RepID=UPI0023F0C548|nr:hypothetical protein [Stecheria intestinalis]MDD5880980.1 hypothetical protein [Stecheria intestinalis]